MMTATYLEGYPGGSWGVGKTHAVPADYPRPNHGDGRDRIHWATARCGTHVQIPLARHARPFAPDEQAALSCKRCVALLVKDRLVEHLAGHHRRVPTSGSYVQLGKAHAHEHHRYGGLDHYHDPRHRPDLTRPPGAGNRPFGWRTGEDAVMSKIVNSERGELDERQDGLLPTLRVSGDAVAGRRPPSDRHPQRPAAGRQQRAPAPTGPTMTAERPGHGPWTLRLGTVQAEVVYPSRFEILDEPWPATLTGRTVTIVDLRETLSVLDNAVDIVRDWAANTTMDDEQRAEHDATIRLYRRVRALAAAEGVTLP
jgi:hypothetical protein